MGDGADPAGDTSRNCRKTQFRFAGLDRALGPRGTREPRPLFCGAQLSPHIQPPGTPPLTGSPGLKAHSAQKYTILGQLWPAWWRRKRGRTRTRTRMRMRTTTKMKRMALRMCSPYTSRLWPGPGAAMWPGSSRALGRASPQMPEAPTGLGTRPQSCFRMCGTSLLTSRITYRRTPMSGLFLGAGGLGCPRRTTILVIRRTGKESLTPLGVSFAISWR